MKIAKLVVHPGSAKQIALEKNSRESLKILENIEKIIDEKETYIIPDEQDPRIIPKCIRNYDLVELYGARHGFCLTATNITLTMAGITSFYSPKGYF